jgi:hypothetical protein
MKTNPFRSLFCFFLFTAALAIFGSGCATHESHSFNDDYNLSLPCAPMYFIEDGGESRFYITVSQGKPRSGAERILDVKRAATAVAETESKRRSWGNWNVDYIMEREQGWMHIVKAEVTPRKVMEYKKGGQP